jgi:hypothetical protein
MKPPRVRIATSQGVLEVEPDMVDILTKVLNLPRRETPEPKKAVSEKSLIRKYGLWGEHPHYPAGRWQYAVAHRNTRKGYWAWVLDKINE